MIPGAYFKRLSLFAPGRSWGIGTGAMVGLAVAAAVAKYTGVYKHPFREDRVYV